ncbi:MAG: hypothetical protein RJA07_1535 [Bacteroidota bacterium]|jgi:sugar O-acyltransferase (sialic acid O-acetyltransferase NeuD family)
MKSKINFDKKICIAGTGGFAREVFTLLIDCVSDKQINLKDFVRFQMPDKDYIKTEIMGIETICDSEFNPTLHQLVIAVGEPKIRKKIVSLFPKETEYATLIHPNAIISNWVNIGEGSIITAGCILTCNIEIGKHAHLNLQSTIGHDCIIGDFFTTAPSVNISGNCTIDECVYFGTKAAIKQGINVCSNVTIGMGGIVVKNVLESGVYIGSPIRKLEK